VDREARAAHDAAPPTKDAIGDGHRRSPRGGGPASYSDVILRLVEMEATTEKAAIPPLPVDSVAVGTAMLRMNEGACAGSMQNKSSLLRKVS
jgi:hypothetical protein